MYFFDVKNLILIITSLLNFSLALLLYFRGGVKQVNRIYAWNIFSLIGWAIAMMFYRASSLGNSLFFAKLLYVSPLFIASTFLYFTYIFPSQDKLDLRGRRWLIFSISFLMFLFVLAPGFVLEGVFVPEVGEKIISFGWGYYLYSLYILSYFTFGFYRLFRKYLILQGVPRARVLYLLVGYSLAANFAFVTNLILPWFGIFSLNWIGQVFNIFIVAFTTYAIVRHRLMDIKLVMRRWSVYIASLSTVFIFAAGMHYLWGRFIGLWVSFFDFLILFASVSLFPVLKNYYYAIANTYLFSSLYDSGDVISRLGDRLRSSIELDDLYAAASRPLLRALHPTVFVLAIYDEQAKCYHLTYSKGLKLRKKCQFSARAFRKFLGHQNVPRLLEDFGVGSTKKFAEQFDLFSSLSLELVSSLNIKKESIGFLALGPKESGDPYNEEDIHMLKVASAQIAIALENALLYERAKEFNEVLKGKVADATKRLRLQNRELKELDRMKTEFVSVASHQLRTPLTATRWALESLRAGHGGRLAKKQKDTVCELATMNSRLINLVNELLNISRIDEGRLAVNPEPTDITALVKELVHELTPIVKKMKLKLHESYDDVPSMKVDPNIIAKALTNILSNAVKYNREGKNLWVSLEKRSKDILITVKDEGIGVPAKERDNLFKKFYRASNAAGSNTEGSGLGLYIAKTAIELSGGTIRFESKEGAGTTFYVTLPLKGSQAVSGERTLA